MPAEITAEELARWVVENSDDDYRYEHWLVVASTFALLTRAHAALVAERDKDDDRDFRFPTFVTDLSAKLEAKDAPERVRCWAWEYDGGQFVTFDEAYTENLMDNITVTPGWFTPDTKGSTDD